MNEVHLETVPFSTVEDDIVDYAIDLVDNNTDTIKQKGTHLTSAIFYVSSNDVGDVYPSLKVSIPKEEVTDSYEWRAAFIFGCQDVSESKYILVGRDGTVSESKYDGTPSRQYSQEEKEDFLSGLEQIENYLVPEINA